MSTTGYWGSWIPGRGLSNEPGWAVAPSAVPAAPILCPGCSASADLLSHSMSRSEVLARPSSSPVAPHLVPRGLSSEDMASHGLSRSEMLARPSSSPLAGPPLNSHQGGAMGRYNKTAPKSARRLEAFGQPTQQSSLHAQARILRHGPQPLPLRQKPQTPMESVRSQSTPTLAAALDFGNAKRMLKKQQCVDMRGRRSLPLARPGPSALPPGNMTLCVQGTAMDPQREDEAWADIWFRKYPNTQLSNRQLEWVPPTGSVRHRFSSN